MQRGNQEVGSAPFYDAQLYLLPTVPELGLTDMGLVDVLAHKLIPLEVYETKID